MNSARLAKEWLPTCRSWCFENLNWDGEEVGDQWRPAGRQLILAFYFSLKYSFKWRGYQSGELELKLRPFNKIYCSARCEKMLRNGKSSHPEGSWPLLWGASVCEGWKSCRLYFCTAMMYLIIHQMAGLQVEITYSPQSARLLKLRDVVCKKKERKRNDRWLCDILMHLPFCFF